MNRLFFLTRCRRRVAAVALLAGLLSACMGIDVSSVRSVGPQATGPGAESAIATGRVQFVVDGAPMSYGLLNRPHLSLFHRQRGVLMSTPETGSDGRYRWQLPPGDYTVAVVFGGMSPAAQPLRLPSGNVIHVNGIVDPGVTFSLRAGTVVDLGTLVVDVESRPARGLIDLGERVFGRLLGLRVNASTDPTPAGGSTATVSAPLRIVGDGAAAASRAKPVQPAAAAPALLLLLQLS